LQRFDKGETMPGEKVPWKKKKLFGLAAGLSRFDAGI
jgi:hypothetical protein